jgi:threonine dehydrogenase-like Zn-dependent dehydrogenase
VDVIKEHTEGRGVDACVITSPAHEALGSAGDTLSHTGRINIYTSYDDTPELPIDANTLHRTEQLITGSEGRTEYDFLQAVRLLCNAQINVSQLISAYTSFHSISEGLEAALGNNTYRVLLQHEA